jgi:hypothetical protein
VVLRRIGEISLRDLSAIGRIQGREGLPYPFACTHPHDRHDKRASAVADELEHGELSVFRDWTDAYVVAEIWVACRVHHSDPDSADRRILAYRAGETGYLGTQRNYKDVVEVSALAALDLGAAIAGSVGLTQPGTRPRIVVPGYVDIFGRGDATGYDSRDDEYSVQVAAERSSQPAHDVVADDQVTAVATVQSRWQPPRRWGVDWTKNYVACIQVEGDGDYIYTPDFSHAVPVTEQLLGGRIDRLIAEDVSTLRLRGGLAT